MSIKKLCTKRAYSWEYRRLYVDMDICRGLRMLSAVCVKCSKMALHSHLRLALGLSLPVQTEVEVTL